MHQRRDFTFAQVRHIWAPSAAFVISDTRQDLIGLKETGLVEYRFQPDSVEVRHVKAPGQVDIDLDELLASVRSRRRYADVVSRTRCSATRNAAPRTAHCREGRVTVFPSGPRNSNALRHWKGRAALHSGNDSLRRDRGPRECASKR